MRTVLILLGWALSVHLMNAYYAGAISERQSEINDLTVKSAALAEQNSRLIQQRDAAIYLAKRIHRGQCQI